MCHALGKLSVFTGLCHSNVSKSNSRRSPRVAPASPSPPYTMMLPFARTFTVHPHRASGAAACVRAAPSLCPVDEPTSVACRLPPPPLLLLPPPPPRPFAGARGVTPPSTALSGAPSFLSSGVFCSSRSAAAARPRFPPRDDRLLLPGAGVEMEVRESWGGGEARYASGRVLQGGPCGAARCGYSPVVRRVNTRTE